MGSQTDGVKGKLELIKRNNEINKSHNKHDNNNCNNNGMNNGNIHIGNIVSIMNISPTRYIFVQLMEAICHFHFLIILVQYINHFIIFHIDFVKM